MAGQNALQKRAYRNVSPFFDLELVDPANQFSRTLRAITRYIPVANKNRIINKNLCFRVTSIAEAIHRISWTLTRSQYRE
jgi:hypothetical protein